MTTTTTTVEPRELAQRETGGYIITLMWMPGKHGENRTALIVTTPSGEMYTKRVNPEISYHAYTHAGLFVPEAWWNERA
jgi:hypothetical protein